MVFSGVKGLLYITGVQIHTYIFRLPYGPLLATLSFHVKMASAQQKAGVVWYSDFKSIVRVQKEFCLVC
jgi:hypothetical protein